MAIAVISSINKTANGTITVPANTVEIIACVNGSLESPMIEGVSMLKIAQKDAESIQPAISIHQFQNPTIATLNFTFTGTYVHFIFLSGAITFRPGALGGYSATGTYTADLTTTTSDLAIGIMVGSIGPCTMKGDTAAFTYVYDTTLDKVGYKVPGDTALTCEAKDTGSSGGYWKDNGVIHHPQTLIRAGYYSYDKTWVAGHYEKGWTYVEGYWKYVMGLNDWVWVAGYAKEVTTWVAGYYYYPQVWHPATYNEAWDEEIPDTWVPAGTSQVQACFVSIKTTEIAGFMSRPNFFQ
jgi:hypothetical protein